jgi:hypothetical protein
MRNIINQMNVKCLNNGLTKKCNWTGKLSDQDAHEQVCPFRLVKCIMHKVQKCSESCLGHYSFVDLGIHLIPGIPLYQRLFNRVDARILKVFSNGRYCGELRNGIPHGLGKFFSKDGSWFNVGVFFEGTLCGQGMCVMFDGSCFEGQWKNNQRHGDGACSWLSGSQYCGQWVNDVRTGHGVFKWLNGDQYTGEFLRGKMHGSGCLLFGLSGNTYNGAWVANHRIGLGTHTRCDGHVYAGHFQADQYHGRGVMTYPNGDRFEGEWSGGLKNGTGTMKYATKGTYTGQWAGGLRHGTGRRVFVNGDVHDGMWVNDRMKGRVARVNGAVYKGEWRQTKYFLNAKNNTVNKTTDRNRCFVMVVWLLFLMIIAVILAFTYKLLC